MNKLARFDWISVLLFAALVGFGLANIYSALYNADDNAVAINFMEKQLISFGIGLLLIAIIQLIDTRFFERYASLIYLLSLFGLLGLWGFGTEVSGARSWYSIGGFSLQPSEFAKVAVALALAKHLGDFNTRIDNTKDYMSAFVIMGIPALLTLLQPDAGTALVLLGFFFGATRRGLTRILFYSTLLCNLFVCFDLSCRNFLDAIWTGVFSTIVFGVIEKAKAKKNDIPDFDSCPSL